MTAPLDLAAGRCFVIAEVAQAHDGSLGAAHAYIDAVARTGADAIKFQTHIAAAESTPGEPWRVKFSYQDATRYDYWKRMEFTEAQWQGLRDHAHERGLHFLSSPFSVEAVDLLTRVGVAAWKVASGEITNPLLFERMAAVQGVPFLVSTGMSDYAEIDAVVGQLRATGVPFALLQCTSMYPTPAEKLGLNVVEEFRARYDVPVGISDHSGTIYPSIAAAALGATLFEVHVAFSRDTFGPDVVASVTVEELTQLVEGVRFVERARAHPVDKDAVAADLAGMRKLFNKSIVAAEDLPAGTTLGPEHLTLKKPGSGLPAARLAEFYGRTLAQALARDEMLHEAHLA